ncbi:MAG: glycosyltransferase family 4 protein [Betaproteobacteria bacterium]|nr:glycosyltransferase family 4 protein [Betaproteobacteria bacterium]
MEIAYYAPLKSPTHGTPSGDRRVAGLLMDALACAGHHVTLVTDFSSFDKAGDAQRQAALRDEGLALARRLVEQWRDGGRGARPDLWLTYHVFYKAPDWLGPYVSAALGIPYVIAEASHAPKRAGGPWAIGHEACGDAIRRADLVVCPSRDDIAGIRALTGAPERILHLPPFLDAAPFAAAREDRGAHRARFAAAHDLDPQLPWLLAVAMMRPGDKLASFAALAAALARVRDVEWRLLVAGDGPARAQVESALESAVPGRTRYLGEMTLAGLAPLCAACDLFAWPAVNEAYGMAMLEAQAAGLPVVSSNLRGVPDVVQDGRTGLLAPPGDEVAFAARIRELLTDPARRRAMGTAAARFVADERGVAVAAQRLADALASVRSGAGPR